MMCIGCGQRASGASFLCPACIAKELERKRRERESNDGR